MTSTWFTLRFSLSISSVRLFCFRISFDICFKTFKVHFPMSNGIALLKYSSYKISSLVCKNIFHGLMGNGIPGSAVYHFASIWIMEKEKQIHIMSRMLLLIIANNYFLEEKEFMDDLLSYDYCWWLIKVQWRLDQIFFVLFC